MIRRILHWLFTIVSAISFLLFLVSLTVWVGSTFFLGGRLAWQEQSEVGGNKRNSSLIAAEGLLIYWSNSSYGESIYDPNYKHPRYHQLVRDFNIIRYKWEWEKSNERWLLIEDFKPKPGDTLLGFEKFEYDHHVEGQTIEPGHWYANSTRKIVTPMWCVVAATGVCPAAALITMVRRRRRRAKPAGVAFPA